MHSSIQEIEEIVMNSRPVCSTPKGICKNSMIEDGIFTSWLNANVNDFEANINKNKHIHCQNDFVAQEIKQQQAPEEQKEDIRESSTPISFIQANSLSQTDENNRNCEQRCLSVEERKREVIVNKIVLRAIRRFYLSIFKSENQKLVQRRYTNVYSEEFVSALNKIIIHKVLPDIQSDVNSKISKYSFDLSEMNHDTTWPSDLTIFLFRFIGFKSKDEIKYNKNIELKGDLIQNWLYHYSNFKLDKLLDILEFRVLFQYAYYFHFDSMLKKDTTLSTNTEEYSKAFNRVNSLILTKRITK